MTALEKEKGIDEEKVQMVVCRAVDFQAECKWIICSLPLFNAEESCRPLLIFLLKASAA